MTSEDLVLAEERTTEADREMILEGKLDPSVLQLTTALCTCSQEKANEVAEEDEFHQAGVPGDEQCDHGGRGVPGRPQQGALEEGEADEILDKKMVQDPRLVLVRHSSRKEKLNSI